MFCGTAGVYIAARLPRVTPIFTVHSGGSWLDILSSCMRGVAKVVSLVENMPPPPDTLLQDSIYISFGINK